MKKSKTSHCLRAALFLTMLLAIAVNAGHDAYSQDAASLNAALDSLRQVGKEGEGYSRAIPAANQLRQTSASKIDMLLNAMADTNPVAENWLRGVIFDVARKSRTYQARHETRS